MDSINIEKWMLKDFSEIERELLTQEAKEVIFHNYSDFIQWIDSEAKMIANDYNISTGG